MTTSFEQFCDQVKVALRVGRRYVSVIETIKGCLDPIGVYERVLSNTTRPACILESVTHGGHGRYSFICYHGQHPMVIQSQTDLECFKRELETYSPLQHETLPFVGGAIGYIGHEAITLIEPTVTLARQDPFGLPSGCLYFFHDVFVCDHEQDEIHLVACVPIADSSLVAYDRACARLETARQLLERPVVPFPPGRADLAKISSNMTAGEYLEMVTRAKAFIASGDVFQIVLSQRFSVPYQGSSLSLYRELRTLNPSPYMFHMDFHGAGGPDLALLGASPEVMVEVQAGQMRIRPIAGTDKRGETPEEDARRAAALLADPKERAEHMMLVDLARNDIGRFCTADSITLPTLMQVEPYSHVMHIVSEVIGKLRPNVHPVDACLGSLPAGTLSGAPKVRALQLISELELSRRGPYGGAFGWFTPEALDTCIFIRSGMVQNGTFYWQTGGGIVADSNPAAEYEETFRKSRALKVALERLGSCYE